jgi:hypothetical protein
VGVLVVDPPPPLPPFDVHVPPPPEVAPVFFPMSHAPVFEPSSGEMQGAQRSSALQMSCGSRLAYCATWGTHTLRQTPAAPFIDLQDGGAAPPDSMRESGTQTPPEQLDSALVSVPGGSCAFGTQCAAPAVQQLGIAAICAGVGGVKAAAPPGVHEAPPLPPAWAWEADDVPAS